MISRAENYDAAGRLLELAQDLASATNDVSFQFGYNASSQIVSRDRTTSNNAYVWQQPANSTQNSTANGLNQISQLSGTNFTYDGRGNLTSTGASAYSYDIHNRLTGAGSATLAYDPAGRLYQTVGAGATTRFQYDGVEIIAEYDGSNVLQRRYVRGPNLDEPVVWYEGSGTGDRRWLHHDQQGSIIAATNSSGTLVGSPNTYDEYGYPGASNSGRFQYTGQAWLPEASLYHYKARAYLPTLGRFLQSDPMLYADGMNMYAYAGNDAVNYIDPMGERVFAIARPVAGGRYHTFIVVAPYRGGPIQARLSTGPNTGVVGVISGQARLVYLTGASNDPSGTNRDDLAAWNNPTLWDQVVELNMSDEEAMSRINTMAGYLQANDIAYAPLGGNGTTSCNSNCPSGYVAGIPNPFFTEAPGWNNWIRRLVSWRESSYIDPVTDELVITAYDQQWAWEMQYEMNVLLYGVPSMPELIPGGFGANFMRAFLMTEGERMRERLENMPEEMMQTNVR